jgi:hypothetical protein
MVRHGNLDITIMPFNDAGNKTGIDRKVLAFAVSRPYDYESLTKEIIRFLKDL